LLINEIEVLSQIFCCEIEETEHNLRRVDLRDDILIRRLQNVNKKSCSLVHID
jgi:hypothetical protein